MKDFINVTLVTGESASIRISSICSIVKKTSFSENDKEDYPQLKHLDECVYVSLIGDICIYRVWEKYDAFLKLIGQS